MSATNRGGKRSPADFYATPEWATCLFLAQDALPMRGRWLEPCAGNGSIVRAVNQHQVERGGPAIAWDLVEFREEEAPVLSALGALDTCDFLPWADDVIASSKASHRPYDVCITNPPFSLAAEFLTRACELADHVAFLLRTDFLASEKRAPMWQQLGIPDIHQHAQRLSFNGHGSDSCDYAWFVLASDRPRRVGTLHMLPLVSREARRVQRLAPELVMQGALL